ncbi:T9SS sorting signal type C domain-containing protein [Flavobacterium fluviale]|uniref:T9SS sorting signal type C domain-containing protein n=1 Tax=Flavobacterium fluviale TaxID=2249356 RepID=UPI0013B3EDE1|nr:T9SS sorting signal type C domain-containing protein [Flavobacterium fluviale]
MKKDLLTALKHFTVFPSQEHFDKSLKFLLILIISLFYNSVKAQTRTHPYISSGTLILPAGMDQVTVEAWGAGGAGGAAMLGGGLARGGGGGGGGAYARGNISTIGFSSLSVVVGGVNLGGEGNGTKGGDSYITGFTSVFNAPGGPGGIANLLSGNPPSGVAGATGALGNLATANGGSSGGGSNSLLSLGLSSGSGGNGGNFGVGAGGAGGAGVASLIGANVNGNPGSTYGGGGAGAASSSNLRTGGNGARGHVNVTYTCKTYSLTATSAANVCVPNGTTSLVTLTGTAASLPKGNYTVTYSTSSPSQNNLTVNMTVTTAGTGQFSATGLNVVGNSTITVVSLASQDCSSTLSANNTFQVVVGTRPTIALGTTTARCASSNLQSTTLPYSTVTNDPTTYSITWNASPSNSFAAVSNSLTPSSINITIPANTQPGTYTGNLTVSNAAGCVSTTYPFTVVINANPAITTTGVVTAVCRNTLATTASLPYTATANSPISYSIDWGTLTDQGSTPFSFGAGAGSINTINVPANTPAGNYPGVLTILNANGCSSSQNISLTVNALPSITTSGTVTAVCQNALATTASLPYTATANSPISYSIDWVTLTDQGSTPFSFGAGAGSINTINVPANTPAGNYPGVLTILNANGCSSSQNISLTVNALPSITTSGTVTAICQNALATTASLPYTATANSPISYSIDWGTLTDQGSTPFSFGAGAGSINTINVPANTPAGNYPGVLTILNVNGCSSSQNISLTVNALPSITTSGTVTAVCQNALATTASLPYTATANSPISYSIDWGTLTDQGSTPFSFGAGAGSINTINVPANTPAGNYPGVLTILNANGCSSSQNISFTVNALPSITTSGTVTAVCQNTLAATASLPYTATANSPISYSIDWGTLTDQGSTPFSFGAGAGNINTINVPANTPAGNYSGVLTILNANGCSSSQNILLIVNGSPTINTTGIFTPVCESTSPQTTTLNYNSTTGSPINYAIDWIALTDQTSTPFTFSSGSGTVINVNVPANATAGTYNGVMTISAANGCPVNQAVSLTINAVSAPSASVTQQPSCQTNSGIITVTVPQPGTGYSYSIDGVDFSNTSGVFTGLAPGVYNVKAKNITSGCESPSTPLNVNAVVTKMWNGSVSASWGDAANWTPAGVPLASDCVTIPDVTTNPIISGTDGSFFANRITVENNGSLIVEGTNTITITNEVNVLGNGVFTFENNASLVQVSNAVNTGNIIYKRDTPPVRRYDLTHWSSPITRVPVFTLFDFSPGTLFDKFYKYDPVTKWIIINSGAEEMVAGKGYTIRAPQNYELLLTEIFHGEFIGVPNNGDILAPEAVAEKFTFFGNPYPSAIYADQFIYDNAANIYGTLFFWTHNTPPSQSTPGTHVFSYNNDDYAIYNLSGAITIGNLEGVGATTPGNQSPPLGYIAAGQGFFAKARTNQRAIFTNSMRVPGRNSQFYKSSAANEIQKHRVWLNLTNSEGAFKQLLIAYVTGATNLWDNNYDAVTMDAHPYIDFYSINQAKKLVIQGREVPFAASDTIPLGYRSALEGEFTIAIDHTDGNLNNQAIYLQDNVTKTLHNLKSGGYKFTTTKGVFQQRFVIRYTDPSVTLGNDDFTGTDRNVYVSVKDKSIKLQAAADEEKLQETAVYDVGGKLLYHKKGIDGKEWIITNLRSGPQVLLVKITLDNGKTFTRKVIFN